MGVNSLPKTVARPRRGCDLNPGPSAPESSTLNTRLASHRAPTDSTCSYLSDCVQELSAERPRRDDLRATVGSRPADAPRRAPVAVPRRARVPRGSRVPRSVRVPRCARVPRGSRVPRSVRVPRCARVAGGAGAGAVTARVLEQRGAAGVSSVGAALLWVVAARVLEQRGAAGPP